MPVFLASPLLEQRHSSIEWHNNAGLLDAYRYTAAKFSILGTGEDPRKPEWTMASSPPQKAPAGLQVPTAAAGFIGSRTTPPQLNASSTCTSYRMTLASPSKAANIKPK